jgi:hypothetical protein
MLNTPRMNEPTPPPLKPASHSVIPSRAGGPTCFRRDGGTRPTDRPRRWQRPDKKSAHLNVLHRKKNCCGDEEGDDSHVNPFLVFHALVVSIVVEYIEMRE